MPDTLAGRLRTKLSELGITQGELANRAGISLGLVEALLAGTRKDPRLSTMVKLAVALKVDLNWLGAYALPHAHGARPACTDEVLFRELWFAGANRNEIAERCGLTVDGVKNTRFRLGLPPRHSGWGGKATAIVVGDKAAEFTEMWTAGASMNAIARRFGISQTSVPEVRKRLGLPPRSCGRPRRNTGDHHEP
jgi:transcriptional regulator with XRE-family HTH domain